MTLGAYEIIEKLVDDGERVLYRAQAPGTGKGILIRVLQERARFETDAFFLKNEFDLLSDPELKGCVKALSLENLDGYPALVMEDPNAKSLRQVLETRRMYLYEKLTLARRIASNLSNLHGQGILHKNISTSSILIQEGTGDILLSEFGLAERIGQHREASFIGACTPEYASPEQTGRTSLALDYRSDIYSLGVVFYELFCGQLPFSAEDINGMMFAHLTQIPPAPRKLNWELPEALEEVLLKMLEKEPDNRYQSMQGLLPDLEWVLQALDGEKRDVFILGRHDVPVRFIESLKPYGKQQLIDQLTEEKAKLGIGRNRLVLLHGESGAGKSYLLQTLYRNWAGEAGTILHLDFTGHMASAPYSALRQALDVFSDYLLTGPADRLRRFRAEMERPVVTSLRQLGGLFPGLLRLFQQGTEPAPESEVMPSFERQISHLASALIGFEPPIIVLVDGLDRIDRESYEVLSMLLVQRYQGGVLMIGSVDERFLNAPGMLDMGLLTDSLTVVQYTVPAYAAEDIQLYLRDAFRLAPKKAAGLSRLIHLKTAGNPYYTTAFIRHCCLQGWIFFNSVFGEWDYKAGEIERHQTMANVTTRSMDRLRQLGDEEIRLLKTAAVLGFEFDLNGLSGVLGLQEDAVQQKLGEAMTAGLITGRYEAGEGEVFAEARLLRFRFTHESIYLHLLQLAEDAFRMQASVLYGRILLDQGLGTTDELGLYLTHMNSASELVTDAAERTALAQRNLEYAIRLKRIGVLERALHHADFGLKLLNKPVFDETDPLCYRLTLEQAELSYLNRRFSEAEACFDALIGNCSLPVNRAKAIRTKMTLYVNQGKMKETIALAAEALHVLDVPFDGTPTDMAVGRELLKYNFGIWGKKTADLYELPVSTDSRIFLITEIYMTLISVSYLVGKNLFIYVILRILNMTLKHGLTMHSSYAFSIYGLIAGSALGNPRSGVAYGELGIRLAERFGSQDMLGKCFFTYGFFLNHWVNHPSSNLPPLQRAIELTEATGDMVFHAYSAAAYILSQLDSGLPLTEVLKTVDSHFDEIQAMHVEDVFNLLVLLRQMVFALQGRTDSPCSFNAVDFDEALFEEKLKASSMQSIYAVYLVQKLKLNYLSGNYGRASEICLELQGYTQELMGLSVYPEYYQYYSLTLLELEGTLQSRTRILHTNQRRLASWMKHAPQNFRHRFLTVQGVWLMKRGLFPRAVTSLTEALQQAQKQGFLQEEALINELLGRCHEGMNQAMIRRMYLKNAYGLFKQWGAQSKLGQLKHVYGDILFDEGQEAGLLDSLLSAGATVSAQGREADLLSVFKSAQTLSSEMQPQELFKRLLEIIRENAGAHKSVILLKQGDIVPVAWTTETGIVIAGEADNEPCAYAETIVNQAARTNETVVIEDVSKAAILRKDPYIIQHSPASLMCVPIQWKGALIGLLYLENNRMSGAFGWNRLEVMQVLTAQFVISYDNAMLYESLRSSETELKNHKYKLERIVEERTAELSSAHFEIQLLLDHAGQGFFSFDQSESIGSELSRECFRIFQMNIAGLRVSAVIGRYCSEEERPMVSRVIEKAFATSDAFQAKVYLSLLPEQLEVQDKIIAVEYQLIEDSESRRIMAILTDITETQELMRIREEEKQNLKTVVKVIRNRNSFLRSLDDYQQFAEQGYRRLAEQSSCPDEALTELFRIVHTFKGDFAQWGLRNTEAALHEIESLIAVQRKAGLELDAVVEFIEDVDFHKALEVDMEILENALGKSFLQQDEYFEVSRAEILTLESLFRNRDYEALERHIKSMRLTNVMELLMPYDDYITTMAFSMDKKVNPLRIVGEDIRIDRKHYYNFIRVLIHIFRNMMDYGIEMPEVRAMHDKPESGTITCTVEEPTEGTLSLRIEDDGYGINRALLLETLIRHDPEHADIYRQYDDHALQQTIFSDGISTGEDVTLLSGRGIGLSAVRAEVERLGGSITVSSREGEGTAFLITLPLIV